MRGQFSSFRSVATRVCAWIEIRDGALLLPCPLVATCECALIEIIMKAPNLAPRCALLYKDK
nr:MAG TPA: hypothetical protein [Caudoviricetes sp.]